MKSIKDEIYYIIDSQIDGIYDKVEDANNPISSMNRIRYYLYEKIAIRIRSNIDYEIS